MDLHQYILELLPDDDAIIEELTGAIKDARHLFRTIPFNNEIAWGYKVVDDTVDAWGHKVVDDPVNHAGDTAKCVDGTVDGERGLAPKNLDRLSQSTVSMIVAALNRDVAHEGGQASSGFPWSSFRFPTATGKDEVLTERLDKAVDRLRRAWQENDADGANLRSTTYGNDDILSLSWHFDLFHGKNPVGETHGIVSACEKKIVERARAFANASSSFQGLCDAFRAESTPPSSDARVGNSCYILLRLTRCLKSLNIDSADDASIVRSAMARAAKRFQSRLHDQLSLAEITDSRFDPAELAFCLEGLLHLKPEQVDQLLFNRVLEVMTKAQIHSAYWRSETPIVIQQRGHVLFPIGVETARSILNSIAHFTSPRDGQVRRAEIAHQYLGIVKRYWAWLKTRRIAIKCAGETIYGWHSEHINDPNLIHTWETSQILEFLLAFREVLKSHVADHLLRLSRLEVRYPGERSDWRDIVATYEPYSREPHNVYARIGADFVEDRMSGPESTSRNWSMLLYGPPGTGKTTVAENIGDHLHMAVITVTVSDFLGEGKSRMEGRAKNIFTVLERQSAIVLFDEMDQFLLDRNSKLFREQDSVFQFLTPGMLTKFAKLRSSKSVIFIIATNYEERIDSAIKRTGRIDQHYLVLPPDNNSRKKILSAACKRVVDGLSDGDWQKLLEASCLLGYTDIKRVAAFKPKTLETLLKLLNEAPRNIQFGALWHRYDESPTRGLNSEIEGLVNLIDEAQATPINKTAAWQGSADFVKFMEQLPQSAKPRARYDDLVKHKEYLDYQTKSHR